MPNTKHRVFAPQEPSRFDVTMRLWVPTMNLKPAEKFGELVVCLPPNANRLQSVPLIAALEDRLKDYCEDDYLVAIGDPTLIAAAACICARRTHGVLRLLKWDRLMSDYVLVEVRV